MAKLFDFKEKLNKGHCLWSIEERYQLLARTYRWDSSIHSAQKELGDIVLIERQQSEGMAKGKALDILESGPIWGLTHLYMVQ